MQEARRNLENCQCKGRKEKEAVKTLMFTGKVLRNQTNNLIGRNKTAEKVNLYHGNMKMEEEGEDSSPRDGKVMSLMSLMREWRETTTRSARPTLGQKGLAPDWQGGRARPHCREPADGQQHRGGRGVRARGGQQQPAGEHDLKSEGGSQPGELAENLKFRPALLALHQLSPSSDCQFSTQLRGGGEEPPRPWRNVDNPTIWNSMEAVAHVSSRTEHTCLLSIDSKRKQ